MILNFIRVHCYKVVLTAVLLMVGIQYGLNVLYEQHRRFSNTFYFTFNLSFIPSDSVNSTFLASNMSLIALLSTNTSEPFPLTFLSDNETINATTDPLLCPLISPHLSGPVPIQREAPSLAELERVYESQIHLGGRSYPENCKSRHKVAIIIPYRNREVHLGVFLQHMHKFLPNQQLDYTIFVVEQAGKTPFNRAMLMNIGAAEALREGNFQCFIFHDVDLLPEDDRNVYSCPEQPRHMSVAIDVFKYKLPYEGLFGGVSAMSRAHFEKVNGFSNLFWGWGGEDDDMSNRVKFHKLIISRYPASIARYTMLSHKKAKPNPHRYRFLRNGAKRSKVDGLTSLHYKRLKFERKRLYTWILVDIAPS